MEAEYYIHYFNEYERKAHEFYEVNKTQPKFLVLTKQHVFDLLKGMNYMSVKPKANPDSSMIFFKGSQILEGFESQEGFYIDKP